MKLKRINYILIKIKKKLKLKNINETILQVYRDSWKLKRVLRDKEFQNKTLI